MNFEKHSNVVMLVLVTRREKGYTQGLGGGYNFTGEIVEEISEYSTEHYTKPVDETIAEIGKGWRDQFVKAELLGTFEDVRYTASVSHGVSDNMGRELGHSFTIWRERSGWDVRPQATRAGRKYGALTRGHSAATLAEAMAICETLAAKGKKNAAKAATRGGKKS